MSKRHPRGVPRGRWALLAAGVLCLTAWSCGGGGGSGLKVPVQSANTGGNLPGTGGVTGSSGGGANLFLDATSLVGLVARSASAAGNCMGTPFLVSQGGLKHCEENPSGPTAETPVSVAVGGKTLTGTIRAGTPVAWTNLTAGNAVLTVTPPGQAPVTLTLPLKTDLTFHLRMQDEPGGAYFLGVYSGSNSVKLQAVDMVGLVKAPGQPSIWHTDEGVSFRDMDGDLALGPGDEVTFDQDMDGLDDAVDTDDDNDGVLDEADVDDDNDGVNDPSDFRDPDEDNDGELNLLDASDLDKDNDGIPDAQDARQDPFLTGFRVMRQGAPAESAGVNQVLNLEATTNPPGQPVIFKVSGGTVSGLDWTVPATPGMYEAAAVLQTEGAPHSRRGFRVRVQAGGAVEIVHLPAGVTLHVGDEYPLNFKVRDSAGNVLVDQPALSVSGSAVSLQGGGVVKAEQPGMAEVIAALGTLRGVLTVNVPDREGPGITVTNEIPTQTISTSVTLVGFVNDETIKEVTVTGGVAETVLKVTDGFFSGPVDIPIGQITLTLTAKDEAGNTGTKTVSLTRLQDQLPVLTLASTPPATLGDTLVLTGTLVDNNTWWVTVTGEGGFENVVELGAGGAFSVNVPLVVGLNSVSVTAVDEIGNPAQAGVSIERRDGGLTAFTSDKAGQTVRPGEMVTLTLQTQGIVDASASAYLAALGMTVVLKDDGVAPDGGVDGVYTGRFTAPGTGPLGVISGDATLADPFGVTGTLHRDDLFSLDTRPVIGSVTCDCAGQTKVAGDVLTFTLSASAYPSTGSASLALNAPFGTVSLTDGDGDGQYTGTYTVPSFGSGALGGTVTFTDSLGNTTTATASNLGTINNAPACTVLEHDATGALQPGDQVKVRVGCGQGGTAFLSLTSGNDSIFAGVQLLDDGQNGDATAGDNIFERTFVMPSCTEITQGVFQVQYADAFNNTTDAAIGTPIVVSAEPRLVAFTTTVSAGATLRGGDTVSFSATAPEAGGSVEVQVNPIGLVVTLDDLGGGQYGGGLTLPLTGTTANLDIRAQYTTAACPALPSDPVVMIDRFSLDNTPQLSSLTHSAEGVVKKGGDGWSVSVEGPVGALSATVFILSTELPNGFTLAQASTLGGGRALYSASVTLPGTGSAEGADIRVDFTDANGNTGSLVKAATMTLDNAAPPVVGNLQGTGGGAVLLTWTRPSSDTLSYRVERRQAGVGNYATLSNVADTSGSVSFTDSTVDNINGLFYDYRVYAIDRVGLESPVAETLNIQAAVSAPSLRRPVPYRDGGVAKMRLTWDFVSDPQLTAVEISSSADPAFGTANQVFSGSLATFETSTEVVDLGPGGSFANPSQVLYYRAAVTTGAGGVKTSSTVSMSVDGLWQVYFDQSGANPPALVRRLLGGATDSEAGAFHFKVTAGMTGLTAKSAIATDNAKSVVLVTRPDAGALSIFDFAGNLKGEVTGLSAPTQLAINPDTSKAFVVVGSGPYQLRRIDYSTPTAPVDMGQFGTGPLGAFQSTTEPLAVVMNLSRDQVLVQGVDAENTSNFIGTESLNYTFTAVAGSNHYTASFTFSDAQIAANNFQAPVIVTVFTRICQAYTQADPLILNVSVNGIFAKRIVVAGPGNISHTLRTEVRGDFFKPVSSSANTIRVESNNPAHTYGGHIPAATACNGTHTANFYIGANTAIAQARFHFLGKPMVRSDNVAVFSASDGVEAGYITGIRSSGKLAVSLGGDFAIPENFTMMGPFNTVRDSYIPLYGDAMDYLLSNPIYNLSDSPPIANREYFDVSARDDWGIRRVGINSSSLGAPYHGWMNGGKAAFSANSGREDLFMLAPWYTYSATGAMAAADGSWRLIRCNDPHGRNGTVVSGCNAASSHNATQNSNANPGMANWRVDGLGVASDFVHDEDNNRMYVCHQPGGTNKLLIVHSDGDGNENQADLSTLPVAAVDAATPGAAWREETADIGDRCQVAVARP